MVWCLCQRARSQPTIKRRHRKLLDALVKRREIHILETRHLARHITEIIFSSTHLCGCLWVTRLFPDSSNRHVTLRFDGFGGEFGIASPIWRQVPPVLHSWYWRMMFSWPSVHLWGVVDFTVGGWLGGLISTGQAYCCGSPWKSVQCMSSEFSVDLISIVFVAIETRETLSSTLYSALWRTGQNKT